MSGYLFLPSLPFMPASARIVFYHRLAYTFYRQLSRLGFDKSFVPMPESDLEQDELVLTEDETNLEKPSLYRVLIHNDNFTTMEFVIHVLQNVFQHSESDSVRIMLNVHVQGVGIAGIYPFEIAEMKVAKVTSLAQANEFPLLCTIEES